MMVTGFLHPGAMGSRMAALCSDSRLWVSADRSDATATRAGEAGMQPVASMDEFVSRCDVIVSICPPGAALEQARTVSSLGFDGVYVDANAVSPDTARAVGSLFENPVDGGVVGLPPNKPGTTRLYLSGERAEEVAKRWAGSALEVRIVPGDVGAASAVKMCFASWTKGTSALLLNIRALAEAEGVTDSIVGEWETSMPDLIARADRAAQGTGPKAWRFVGEMEEIAASFAAADLASGFHLAAAEVYQQMSGFKDQKPGPTLRDVVAALLHGDDGVTDERK